MALSAHDSELLKKAIPYVEKCIQSGGAMPGRNQLREFLKTGVENAQRIRLHIISNNLVDIPEPVRADLKEENVIDKDTWRVSINKTHMRSLPELIAHLKVDETVWEVERWKANRWEMGFVKKRVSVEGPREKSGHKTKTQHNQSGAQELWQITAQFRRKQFNTLSEYAKDNARLRSQVEKLKLRVSSESELVKRLAQNHAGYDDILANVKEFTNALGDLSLPYEKLEHKAPLIAPAVAEGHTEDAVLLLSDTHYGDQIRREDTSGFPEYDLVIGGNRTGYVIRKAKQVLTLHRAMYPIKKLYVWVGGDIGNGDLHDAPKSNELFLPAQVHFSYHMLKFAIEDLHTLTIPDALGNRVVEEIVLLFTVGNHMRMDEKMPTKLQAQRTLDWLIYQFLIDRFKGTPGITVKTEMSPYIFESIRGHRHLFAHGMQVGYKNSPDAQCKSMGQFIDRVRALFDSPEWRRKNKLTGETFARACIGDIHVPVSFPRLVSNGSLNGQNELGVNWTLEPIPAGQQLFGVSDKHIETWKYFIECSHVQRDHDDYNHYGRFAADYSRLIGR
jgi:hypothetical protein